jgi:HEAT repeat protein
LLLGIELLPNRAMLDAAGGDATEPALIAIADDTGAQPTARLRALVALGLYASAQSQAFLGATVVRLAGQKKGLGTLLLRAAASSLCRAAGDGAVEQVSPLLTHPVKDVRAEAAEALALTRSSRALRALRSSLLTEEDAMVRLAMVDAIRVLSPLPTGP